MKKIFSVIVIFSMIFSMSSPGFAANGTWLNTGVTSASWVNTNNWSAGTVPGATGGVTTNTDVATFNTAIGANAYGTVGTPIIIDTGRNIDGISFDTAAGNYFIGSTSLNPLLLTSGGTTSILSTLTSTNATETINAPLIIEGTAGTYTLSNNSANGAGAGAGTLDIGGGITGGAAGATVLILSGSNTNSNTISGIIANGTATSVAITKSGAGRWILSGTNTYTGNTAVTAGVLNIQNGNALGSGAGSASVTSGADLQIQGGITTTAEALTLNGTGIAASGALENVSGNNTYAGLVTLGSATRINSDSGTLTLSNAGTITGSTDALTVGGLGNTIINSIIGTGTGTLTKDGTGTLTLTGANTYSGGTTISAGTLQAENTNALGTGAVINNAVLAIGTTSLLLGGAYSQNSGSTLDLTANSSSSFGKITDTSASPSTVSSASTVNVTVGGYIPNNATLEIINTQGTGITAGTPPTTTTSESGGSVYSPRVSFTSSIVNGDLFLTANHATTGFASLANNANAQAAGSVLDNVTNPSSDMTNVLNTLEFLSNAQTTSALNTVGPVVDGGVRDNSTAALNDFIGTSLERLQKDPALSEPGNSASTGVSSGDESALNGIWAKQYGGYLDQGTRQGIQGYNAWNTGTAVGLDRRITDDITLGASVGYSYGQVDSDANNASTDINSAQGTLYAGYQDAEHPYFIDAAGSFAWDWYDGQRDINVGTINRIADADYNGQQYGAYLGTGYKFDLGQSLEITPLASLQWTHLSLGSYDETNADSLDLNVNRQSYDILESAVGACMAYPVQYGWGNFTPEVHAKWLYDYIGDDMVVTSAFSGGGGSFTTNGAKPAKSGIDLGGKLSFDFKNDISLIAGVDTEMKDDFFGVSGTVTVRYKF